MLSHLRNLNFFLTHFIPSSYRSHWIATTPALQSFFVYFSELYKFDFDREIIIANDGGTLAIDWALDLDTGVSRPKVLAEGNKPSKSIILMAQGLGGGTKNFYTLNLLQQARK